MGIPVLFTDTPPTPDIIVQPLSGLWLEDELYLSDQLYLDEGPDAQAVATAPSVPSFGVTVSVDAATATATAGNVTLVGVTDFVVAITAAVAQATAGDLGTVGQDLVVGVDAAVAHASSTVPETQGGQLLILVPSVRELPPLRLHHVIVTPSGRHYRWGEDDPNPANVPSEVRFSDTMPGGFENADATLPRKPGQDSPDLERLSTWAIRGSGDVTAWEGRIERAPSSSGDEVSVSPSAVGWQAHLDDDKSVTAMYVDRDMSHWRGPGATRQIANNAGNVTAFDVSTEADTSGVPALKMDISGSWVSPKIPLAEAWYDAGPDTKVAAMLFRPAYAANVDPLDSRWTLLPHVFDSESGTGSFTSGTDAFPATTTQNFSPVPPRRFALLQWYFIGTPGGTAGVDWSAWIRDIYVFGDHGLPVRSNAGSGLGFFASDIVSHAISKFAPGLTGSYGSTSSTIQRSGFVIPHATFQDRTTASEIVRQATRFGLQDWAVWDNKTFWWHDRGARGRKWRARVGPTQLSETGPSVDRLWNSIIVQYQDVDGTTRTVGPPGSGADWEDSALVDPDPDNPATRAGITRRDLLVMGTAGKDPLTGRPSAPIEIGQRFLEESKLLDGSGQARFVGYVESDRGVTYPYWAPRAGDTVVFVDAADTSERRIVRSEKDHGSRTCTIDLDAPPQGLEALLERLGVDLVPLGVGG